MPYSLDQLTKLARKKANGVPLSKSKIKCVIFPCPDSTCKTDKTHVHLRGKYLGLIILEPDELFMPRWAQDWMISHEVSHLKTEAKHGTKEFTETEANLLEKPHSTLYPLDIIYAEYVNFRSENYITILQKIRKYYMMQGRKK